MKGCNNLAFNCQRVWILLVLLKSNYSTWNLILSILASDTLEFRLDGTTKVGKWSLLLISWCAPDQVRYQSRKVYCKCYITPFYSCLITIWRVPSKGNSKVCDYLWWPFELISCFVNMSYCNSLVWQSGKGGEDMGRWLGKLPWLFLQQS